MKPIDVKDNTYINIHKEVNDKKPKFKYQNTKTFFLNVILQMDLKKFL